MEELAAARGVEVDSAEFAEHMDAQDPLREFRDKFQYPKISELPLSRLKKVTSSNNVS